MPVSYVLAIKRRQVGELDELAAYLQWLSPHAEVIVVDGSPAPVFDAHRRALPAGITHLPPEVETAMGKVGGVVTGLRLASRDKVVIADDDVRYTLDALRRMADLLDRADVVRPQNYFDPLPWHARWDTARTLLNRLSGGDWPGTLGVRRRALPHGYHGAVMFENLELVRTVKAGGGTECVPLDLFVRRLPPTARHFWSQRVRQAYDELARPVRLLAFMVVIPCVATMAWAGRWWWSVGAVATVAAAAEAGRRRSGGAAYFPATSSLLAPVWLAERSVCVWLALWSRVRHGGIRYNGNVIRSAATPLRTLRKAREPAPLPF